MLTLRFLTQKLKVQNIPFQKWIVVLNCDNMETPTFYNQFARAVMESPMLNREEKIATSNYISFSLNTEGEDIILVKSEVFVS